ncbi:MAG TPA: tRNA pseudouridine(13) synthase TruD [Gemmatales bacterium]|nr:tRNA pseudouridine(13) synthase TruD [Gemmatales bacterium]HMP59431.1 tRNA pseudouridine(13) synthase TruD [Gemmatales bacterium]
MAGASYNGTMALDLPSTWPLLTADLPGIGGQVKVDPDDFEVEELPAYEPSGSGDHLYLWVAKRDMGAEFFLREVARALGLAMGDVGMAGVKDRRAVTRQWISVPAGCSDRVPALAERGILVEKQARHTNKLRTGHLIGNRFTVRLRGVAAETAERLPPLLERLRQGGFPNYYGEQRFGRDGETLAVGLKLLQGERLPAAQRFLRKMALSAVQSVLFNHVLARRLTEGLLHQVLPGDLMRHWPRGGHFVVEDAAREQARFDAHQIVTTGPMFGVKMQQPGGPVAEREAAVLAAAGLALPSFAGFGGLLQGTRRPLVCFVDDLSWEMADADAVLRFTLPAGSYATVLLDEIRKASDSTPEGASEASDARVEQRE